MKIRIGSLLDLSTIDWQGHTTFMVFCAGCNLRCPFCQNSSLIPMNSGGEVELEVVKEGVLANLGFLDGLGFTGGEPGLQPKPVMELCGWAKKRGLKTFLNTNGSNPSFVKELLERRLVDYVAFDIKAPLRAEAYRAVAGLGEGAERIVANVRKTIETCKKFGVAVEARTTVVPTLMDDEGSFREIAAVVKDCSIYVLQEFFPVEDVLDENLRRLKPTDRGLLIKLAKVSLEEGVGKVYIRTRQSGMEEVFR